jgi:GH24 family phage-related lysozyme (muramidase)
VTEVGQRRADSPVRGRQRLPATALAAITDFAFNLGLARLKCSTLCRRLLASDIAGAAGELRKWTRAGGRQTHRPFL